MSNAKINSFPGSGSSGDTLGIIIIIIIVIIITLFQEDNRYDLILSIRKTGPV